MSFSLITIMDGYGGLLTVTAIAWGVVIANMSCGGKVLIEISHWSERKLLQIFGQEN